MSVEGAMSRGPVRVGGGAKEGKWGDYIVRGQEDIWLEVAIESGQEADHSLDWSSR